METLCEITIEIGGYRKDREKEIKQACIIEWAFREDDFCYVPVNRWRGARHGSRKMLLQASALGTAYGNEDKQDIIERLERAVWRANGGMCHVEVTARRMNGNGLFESATADEEDLIAV